MTQFPTLAARVLRLAPLAALGAVLALAAPAAAQTDGHPIAGRVVDARSGEPLANVRLDVEQLRLRAHTDEEGRFRFEAVPPGLYGVRVRHIGYEEQRADLVSAPGTEEATISLSADPVLLEAFEVQVDRFDRRRNALPFSVRTIRRAEWVNRALPDARQALLQSIGLTACGGTTDRDCVMVRGRPSRINLWVDERPAIGGLADLESYEPEDVYMVEVYRGGAHVRVYTVDYMERAARSRIIPEPIRI